LRAIYELTDRSDASDAPSVTARTGKEALVALIGHSYAGMLLDKQMRIRDLDVLGRVAAAVQVRRVTPHRNVGRLSALCDVIVEDFEKIVSASAVPVCTK